MFLVRILTAALMIAGGRWFAHGNGVPAAWSDVILVVTGAITAGVLGLLHGGVR